MPEQLTMFDNGENYQDFVDKFKPKKTTDDCYTPENIYEAVAEWVAGEYGVARDDMVRPFWPGGDYQAFDYPPGCCVVDNPPFSLLARIMRFYAARGVRFFLFAPTLTLFSGRGVDVTYLPTGVQITYENGAKVNTSFVTNLDTCLLRTVPDLYRRVRAENDRNEKAMTKQLPKYSYPPHVLTAAAAYQLSHYGQAFRLEKSEAMFIRHLDAMVAEGKGREIFGGGYLLSDHAASRRAAAEVKAAEAKAAEEPTATSWALSEREKRIVAGLGQQKKEKGPAMDPFDLDYLMEMEGRD